MLAVVSAVLAMLALTMLAASPARADRCDDLAGQLKSQIDGLAVGKTAANLIYLSHPQAKQITLGCAGRNYSNQLYAKSASRKPKPAFVELVASATAIHFAHFSRRFTIRTASQTQRAENETVARRRDIRGL